MTPLAKFSLKLAIYGGISLYVVGDLFWFDGPLRGKINQQAERGPTPPDDSGVVARVLTYAITRSQLSRAIHERLWLEGKSPDSLQPAQRQWLTYAVLGDLIHHELLRVKAKAHATRFRVTPDEIDARYREFSARFPNEEDLRNTISAQGIGSVDDLKARLAAEIQQERYLESRIAPLIDVTDSEIETWHRDHAADFSQPERLQARHVFLATLERPVDQARQQLESALADLQSGKSTFDMLASTLSEDESTRAHGGNLGWMSRSRLPNELASLFFALPLHTPSVVTSHIGVHLVEVTDRKPAESRNLDACRTEIRCAISAVKRQKAVSEFLDALRRLEAGKIEIFHDRLKNLP